MLLPQKLIEKKSFYKKYTKDNSVYSIANFRVGGCRKIGHFVNTQVMSTITDSDSVTHNYYRVTKKNMQIRFLVEIIQANLPKFAYIIEILKKK